MAGEERSGRLRFPWRGGASGQHAPGDWRATIRTRLLVTAVGFAVWTISIEARLLYLQVYRHADFVARAASQQMQTVDAPAKRGDILDRNGRLLAYSVDAESLWADPARVDDVEKTASAICRALDECSASDLRDLGQSLRRKARFAFLQRKLSPAEERRLKALDLPGVGFLTESRRFYPNRELLAHVLGYVGTDNVGLGGLESRYDSQVRGRPGKIIVETDAHQRPVSSRVERQPTSGASLELSIDEVLQHIAERELRQGVLENRAAGGSAIIMNPWTGEILALANYPGFNPNIYGRFSPEIRRNSSTQETYEPGSTFKIVTASAALEEHVIDANDPVDCAPGVISFGSRSIRDVHAYGVLPFSDVIAKSSNVGAIRVGLRVGRERLGRYISRFGFGHTLSPDFEGESPGIVWNTTTLDASALASVTIGYQIAVTPLQMAAAVSSIANGGTLYEPRVVRAFIKDGRRTTIAPKALRRTVSERTALELTAMMEGVIEHGTAKTAQIDGYTLAGKTGTAQKLVNRRYSTTDYNASFVGFLPSRKPALTIVVVVDSPRAHGYYGAVVAAPIFRRIAEASLRHLGIPQTINPPPPVLLTRHDPDALRPTPVRAALIQRALEPARAGLMPDLRGLSARDAVRMLTRVGMTAQLSGSGFVVEQSPAAGSPLVPGAMCALTLGRRPPPDPSGDRTP
jgi:cell division protein FtsI (penicillin-binding protein 3)